MVDFDKLRKKEEEKPAEQKKEFVLVGWINRSKNGKHVIVKDDDNNTIGMCFSADVIDLLRGERDKGVPLKIDM